jgi:hypothetical protein
MNAAQSPIDFSGVWRLNFARSTIRGQAPKVILMKIEHREPSVVQQIHVTYDNGHEQTLSFAYETTGEETGHFMDNGIATSRAHWEHSELVIESSMKTPEREFHFKDYWSLSSDGRTLTMAHRNDDLDGQISVLDKEASERDTPFYNSKDSS